MTASGSSAQLNAAVYLYEVFDDRNQHFHQRWSSSLDVIGQSIRQRSTHKHNDNTVTTHDSSGACRPHSASNSHTTHKERGTINALVSHCQLCSTALRATRSPPRTSGSRAFIMEVISHPCVPWDNIIGNSVVTVSRWHRITADCAMVLARTISVMNSNERRSAIRLGAIRCSVVRLDLVVDC